MNKDNIKATIELYEKQQIRCYKIVENHKNEIENQEKTIKELKPLRFSENYESRAIAKVVIKGCEETIRNCNNYITIWEQKFEINELKIKALKIELERK